MSECRLCLETESPIYIFDESKSLSKKIQDCCGLTILRDDGLPDQICFHCEMKLNCFIEFKQTCVENHNILLNRHKGMIGEIADSKMSMHIYDRSDIPNCPDEYQDFEEKYSPEDIKPQLSEATRFNCLSTDTFNEPMPNVTLSKCRFCLQNELPIYIFNESKFLPEKILDFCGLLIMQNDGLPDKICFSCEMKLDAFIEFKQMCLKNYIILKERHIGKTDEITDSKNFINVFDGIDISHSLNSDLNIDEKYTIEDVKISQESEAAWIDYLSRNPTNEDVKISQESEAAWIDYLSRNPTNEDVKISQESEAAWIDYLSRNPTNEPQIRTNHLNKTYECDTCHKILKNRPSFMYHLKMHMNEVKKHRCNECGYKTLSKQTLIRHIESMHLNRTYECDICGKILKYRNSIIRHLNLHIYNVDKKYRCDKCDFKTNHRKSLKDHNEILHLNKTYECDICHKILKSRTNCIQHIKLHMNGVEKHQCDKCDFITDHKKTFIQHIESIHLNKTYKCDLCHRILKSRVSFRRHLKMHINLYQCDICDFKSNHRNTFVQHIERIHLNKTYKCEICHKIFNYRSTLFRHLKLHKNIIEKRHQCDKCDFQTDRKSTFIQHVENIHFNKSYGCNICPKFFKTSISIQRHLKLHNIEKRHQCDKCDFKTNRKIHFDRHVENVHLNKTFECDICLKILKNRNTYTKHVKLHMNDMEKKYQCDKCDFKTVRKNTFIQHVENIHFDNSYNCGICNKVFKTSISIQRHLKLHNNMEKRHQCDKCDFKTDSKSTFIYHVENIHLNKAYDCNICHKVFKTKSLIQRHLRSHNNIEKRHQCDKCNFKTNSKSTFINHVESKHLNKAYDCGICNKVFKTKLSIQRHLRLHKNIEKRHKCDKCDYKTNYKSTLNYHVENKHLNKKYDCDICHKILKTKISIQRHLKFNHLNERGRKKNTNEISAITKQTENII